MSEDTKREKRDELQNVYWKHLLLKGSRPKSVFALMDSLEREEEEFYHYYASLESLEAYYWQSTVDATITVLKEDEEYADYLADQKLLAFFFTFITHIQSNRSRFVEFFPKPGLCSNAKTRTKGMRHSFKAYAREIVAEGVQQGVFADRKKLTEQYDRFIWMHFLSIIHYYIKDNSESFQDTDAFIEKSTHFGIQSAASGVLESGFDFLRFVAAKDERFRGLSKMMSKFIPK